MPGLINRSKKCPLPLSSSEISACVRGYTLAITASLSYDNMEDHPIEGLFVYPLDEGSTVVGFEAMISRRIITLQVKDKAKIDDCYYDCCTLSNGTFQSRIVLDEDLESSVLVVNLGIIPPLETVTVLVSTSSELATLPNGAIRVLSPSVCTPRVQQPGTFHFLLLISFNRDRHHCTLGPHEPMASNQLCLAWLLEDETINSIDYEFNFHLEIKGPCLLAGVESPTHAIRADADPSAHSATSVVITLADKYTFDQPVEILIYPCEPFVPHILIEEGDLSTEEYEEHLKGRSEFIKGIKKDASCEKKAEIIRKRLHKDILHHPVVMLNFCPDLKVLPQDLRKVQGEFVFLIDRSGSMSGVNISRVKDAMIVILKSLVPGCLFNIIGFGSTFKTLFPASQMYQDDTLTAACDYIKRIRADMGGTNVLAPLNWILRQPVYRGHPRLLFLLTDGAVSNTGRVIELVRNHARSTRCFSFGIGQNACRRLVLGLSAVSKGSAEFLLEGERLQPKMIKSLKKAMAPALTDVSIEWFFPETKEVLLSPVGSSCLFPGDRLIGYSIVCDTMRYHPNPKSEKRRRYSMMHSNDSTSSVFYHSQEEDLSKESSDSQRTSRDVTLDSQEEWEQDAERDSETHTSPRRRAYSTNQLVDPFSLKRAFTASDPNAVANKNPLRRAKVQDLLVPNSPETGGLWIADMQVGLLDQSQVYFSIHVCLSVDTLNNSQSGSPPLSHCTSFLFFLLLRFYNKSEFGRFKQKCKAAVSGLLYGKAVQWEVTFDISPLLKGREREEKVHEDLWSETFHHLAARSIIRDFEQMAERECEIEHGSGRRYQLSAIQTSKACNIISKYTAFVPIDLDSNEYLPTVVEYSSTGLSVFMGSFMCLLRSQNRPCSLTFECFPLFSKSLCRYFSVLTIKSNLSSKVLPLNCFDCTSFLFSLLVCFCRLSLSRTRLLSRAARGFMSKSPSKVSDAASLSLVHFIFQVSLQSASGYFMLNNTFCEAINIPQDKLKWTSPFAIHRTNSRILKTENELCSLKDMEPEGLIWATTVALAWLEHSSAGYFIEWELVAAKASMWLSSQEIPEGRDLVSVKAAARQLFVLLRHWDENLQLNMLCYNPNSV
uniref:von Willebrand factor A domain containing 5B1 n=1 Tax=Erpetoichthys calabaricus TaxID=27687 RepID=A0A8C4TI88_ERPCA